MFTVDLETSNCREKPVRINIHYTYKFIQRNLNALWWMNCDFLLQKVSGNKTKKNGTIREIELIFKSYIVREISNSNMHSFNIENIQVLLDLPNSSNIIVRIYFSIVLKSLSFHGGIKINSFQRAIQVYFWTMVTYEHAIKSGEMSLYW